MRTVIQQNGEENEAWLIHEIARQMRTCFDRRVQHLGLTRSQWRVLGVLRRFPGIKQAKLADMIEVEPITLVRLLDRMQKSGWVERRPDPRDRRANGIFLTKKVSGIMSEMLAVALELRRGWMRDFSGKEYKQLLGYLKRIKQNMGTDHRKKKHEIASKK